MLIFTLDATQSSSRSVHPFTSSLLDVPKFMILLQLTPASYLHAFLLPFMLNRQAQALDTYSSPYYITRQVSSVPLRDSLSYKRDILHLLPSSTITLLGVLFCQVLQLVHEVLVLPF
ncbi:hypothetical protein B0T13DRAFT_62361 [Neurospora crassa]|nr:hypothetical protein B0T13DRAFT_62361 [Neurospora crassa]